MTVKEAVALLQSAVEDGRGDQEFIIAIRTGESTWLEARASDVGYEDELDYTIMAGHEKRETEYSRGKVDAGAWGTWEDEK